MIEKTYCLADITVPLAVHPDGHMYVRRPNATAGVFRWPWREDHHSGLLSASPGINPLAYLSPATLPAPTPVEDYPESGWRHPVFCWCDDCLDHPIVCPECGTVYDLRASWPYGDHLGATYAIELVCPTCSWRTVRLACDDRDAEGKGTIVQKLVELSPDNPRYVDPISQSPSSPHRADVSEGKMVNPDSPPLEADSHTASTAVPVDLPEPRPRLCSDEPCPRCGSPLGVVGLHWAAPDMGRAGRQEEFVDIACLTPGCCFRSVRPSEPGRWPTWLYVDAAGAEGAVAEVLHIDGFRPRSDVRGVVGDAFVRWSLWPEASLVVHEDEPDDAVFIHVTGTVPTYTVLGWVMGRDAKQDRYRATES